jgi:hypothetical protein
MMPHHALIGQLNFMHRLWYRYNRAVLTYLALFSVFIWGLNLGRELGSAAPTTGPTSARTSPIRAETTSSPTPTGEHVTEVAPGRRLNFELEPRLTEMTPPAEPRLRVRLDIRDLLTEKPIRAGVWLITIKDKDSQAILIMENTSLVEFALPASSQADEVSIMVQAPGYHLWAVGIRHQVDYNRLLPLPINLERILVNGGRG